MSCPISPVDPKRSLSGPGRTLSPGRAAGSSSPDERHAGRPRVHCSAPRLRGPAPFSRLSARPAAASTGGGCGCGGCGGGGGGGCCCCCCGGGGGLVLVPAKGRCLRWFGHGSTCDLEIKPKREEMTLDAIHNLSKIYTPAHALQLVDFFQFC